MMIRYFLVLLFALIATPAHAIVPTDPSVEQWGYEEVGAYTAWDLATGSKSVVVAIIDSGIDMDHPDLEDNIWKNTDEIAANGIDDDENGYIDDVWGWNFAFVDEDGDGYLSADESHGNNNSQVDLSVMNEEQLQKKRYTHGSLVAGIVGAVGNNSVGIAGINWNVRLMNLKARNNGGEDQRAQAIAAIHYAVDNGADVINMSFSAKSYGSLQSAIDYAYEHGVVVVSSAGNNSYNLNEIRKYPVCSDANSGVQKILGVSAINEQSELTSFSNAGADCVDITAPGQNMKSTTYYSPAEGYNSLLRTGINGTSFAAPMVSGAAALIKSIQPSWGPKQIYSALLSTAYRKPDIADVDAYNNLFGAGILQIDKAVAYALDRLQSGSIVFFDRETQRIVQRTIDTGEEKVKAPRAIRGADSLASFMHDSGQRWYIATEKQSTDTIVRVYNANWRKQYEWKLAVSDLYIEVGNVYGDDDKELVIASKDFPYDLFRVYSLDGEWLDMYWADSPYDSATIAIAEDAPYDDIIIMSKHADGLVLTHMDDSDIVLRTFPVTLLYEPGPMAVGDVDGDGTSEYILAGPAGSNPFLVYLNEQGKGKRRIYPYGEGYQEGFSVVVDNYYIPSEGAEVLTIPTTNQFPMRSWSGKAKLIDEWTLQPNQSITQLQLAQ